MSTLAEVSEKISEGNRGIEMNRNELIGIRSGLDSFLRFLKESRLDKLEEAREKTTPKLSSAAGTAAVSKNNDSFNLLKLGGLAALTAGIAATLAALEGLRGWEVKALKNIDKLGKAIRGLFPTSLGNLVQEKYKNLRVTILRSLGFDTALKKFNSPESGLKTPLGQQILERVSKFRTSILNSFGIGADGKPIVVQGKDGKFKVPVVGRITGAIQDLLTPVIKFADGITSFIGGAGAKLFGFLSNLGIVKTGGKALGAAGGAVAGVAKLAGKILLPLGILFSAFDAFKAWQETEGTFGEKFTAASFAFLGDFIGAPLDLLKKGIVFLYRKGLGLEVDEDGNIVGDGFAAAIGRALQGFSFEETIKAIPNFIMSVFDSVTQLFKDPVGTAKDILGGLVDSVKSMFFGIIKSVGKVFGIEIKTDQEKAAEKADNLYQRGANLLNDIKAGRGGLQGLVMKDRGLQTQINKLRAVDPTRAAQLDNQRLQLQGIDPTLARAATIDRVGGDYSTTNIQHESIIGGSLSNPNDQAAAGMGTNR